MQGMLFPPLEDESISRDVNGSGDEEGTDENNSNIQVLPQLLRDRFSKVRSLLREKASKEDTDSTAQLKRKQEQAALETARAVQDEVSRLQNGIAELEAMYAQQRQQQLLVHDDGEGEEDIDESDVDIDDEEDDGQGGPPGENHHNNAGIVFPALPSLVNAVEPDLDADADSNQGSSSTNDANARESEPLVTTENILCDA